MRSRTTVEYCPFLAVYATTLDVSLTPSPEASSFQPAMPTTSLYHTSHATQPPPLRHHSTPTPLLPHSTLVTPSLPQHNSMPNTPLCHFTTPPYYVAPLFTAAAMTHSTPPGGLHSMPSHAASHSIPAPAGPQPIPSASVYSMLPPGGLHAVLPHADPHSIPPAVFHSTAPEVLHSIPPAISHSVPPPEVLPPAGPQPVPHASPRFVPLADPHSMPPAGPNPVPPTGPNSMPPAGPHSIPLADPNSIPPAGPHFVPPAGAQATEFPYSVPALTVGSVPDISHLPPAALSPQFMVSEKMFSLSYSECVIYSLTPDMICVSHYAGYSTLEISEHIRTMEESFKGLKKSVIAELTRLCVAVRDVVGTLTELPVSEQREHQYFLLQHLSELERSVEHRSVFARLDFHWNYLSPQLLYHLIHVFLFRTDVEQQRKLYDSKLKRFRNMTLLSRFCRLQNEFMKPPNDFSFIVIKFKEKFPVPDDITLQHVEEFRLTFAKCHRLRDFALMLFTEVRLNSYIVSFLVPSSVVEMLQCNVPQQVLIRFGVTGLNVAGECVFGDLVVTVPRAPSSPTPDSGSEDADYEQSAVARKSEIRIRSLDVSVSRSDEAASPPLPTVLTMQQSLLPDVQHTHSGFSDPSRLVVDRSDRSRGFSDDLPVVVDFDSETDSDKLESASHDALSVFSDPPPRVVVTRSDRSRDFSDIVVDVDIENANVVSPSREGSPIPHLMTSMSGTIIIHTHIQWNLSNLDTNGASVSLLVRCPHFRG